MAAKPKNEETISVFNSSITSAQKDEIRALNAHWKTADCGYAPKASEGGTWVRTIDVVDPTGSG